MKIGPADGINHIIFHLYSQKSWMISVSAASHRIVVKAVLIHLEVIASQNYTLSLQGLRLTCDQVELVSSLVQSAQSPIDDVRITVV